MRVTTRNSAGFVSSNWLPSWPSTEKNGLTPKLTRGFSTLNMGMNNGGNGVPNFHTQQDCQSLVRLL